MKKQTKFKNIREKIHFDYCTAVIAASNLAHFSAVNRLFVSSSCHSFISSIIQEIVWQTMFRLSQTERESSIIIGPSNGSADDCQYWWTSIDCQNKNAIIRMLSLQNSLLIDKVISVDCFASKLLRNNQQI